MGEMRDAETVKVASDGNDILSAEALVFPGVGNFGSMMRILNQKQMRVKSPPVEDL